MSHIIKDRVMEVSTTTGTGNFALAGAVTGFIDFDSVMANGDTCHYFIEAVDASGIPTGEWEAGFGTFNDTDTLVRTAVHASSNAGAAVSFSAGTKRVAMAITAAAKRSRGALVKKSVDQTAADYSGAGAVVTWNSEDYDTDAFHDTGSNTERLTVPTGVTKVRLSYSLVLSSVAANDDVFGTIRKNGSDAYTGVCSTMCDTSASTPRVCATSPVLAVTAGDYFDVILVLASDTSITVLAQYSWFSIEVVE